VVGELNTVTHMSGDRERAQPLIVFLFFGATA
jgi:hypothetical protein